METPAIWRAARTKLPTRYGTFTMTVYNNKGGKEHVALTVGSLYGEEPILVRLHSECLTGDIFGSCRCDCGEQLDYSMGCLQQEGHGVLLYMRQEGRGIGLTNKARAYALQDRGYDTVEANLALGFPPDMRDYSDAAWILRDLEVERIQLLTNNPAKTEALTRLGIDVVAQIPLLVRPNSYNLAYLRTKYDKMGHSLSSQMLFGSDQG
jgi:GTP cyclohydrolase II